MESLKEFIGYFTGEGSRPLFFACLVFLFLTAAARMSWDVNKGVKEGKNTPNVFSWKFLYWDNLVRIWGTVVLGYLLVRFARPYAFPIILGANGGYEEKLPEIQLLSSAILGLFLDMITNWLRKLRWFANKNVREKFKAKGLTDAEQDQIENA